MIISTSPPPPKARALGLRQSAFSNKSLVVGMRSPPYEGALFESVTIYSTDVYRCQADPEPQGSERTNNRV